MRLIGIVITLFFSLQIANSYAGIGYTWKKCTTEDETTSPINQNGYVLDSCSPDTLYSWMSKNEVLKLIEDAHSNFYSKPHTYTWKTPVGSFGYGDTLVRYKLKTGVMTKLITSKERNCLLLKNKYNFDFTIFVIKLAPRGYSEFLVCGSGPFHSWSTGTAEILREIKRELKWMKWHSSSNYDMFFRHTKYPWGILLDDMPFTKEHLKNNIAKLKQTVQLNEGQIYFSDANDDEYSTHYSTSKPIYFNPD